MIGDGRATQVTGKLVAIRVVRIQVIGVVQILKVLVYENAVRFLNSEGAHAHGQNDSAEAQSEFFHFVKFRNGEFAYFFIQVFGCSCLLQ